MRANIRQIKYGFTIAEMLIVIIVIGILLGMTFQMGNTYLQSVEFRKDRETFIANVEEVMTIARSSNYYGQTQYSHIDMIFAEDRFNSVYATGDALSGQGAPMLSYDFEKSTVTLPTGYINYYVRLYPYELGCGSGVFSFDVNSTVSNHETCFDLFLSTCKLQQTLCD